MIVRLLSFICLLAVLGCTPKMADQDGTTVDTADTAGPSLKVAYEEQADLSPGQSLQVNKAAAAFTFSRVVTDSRCPTGLDCIQAGEAVVLVTLPDGSGTTVRIPANSRTPITFSVPDGSVTVSSLKPYPAARQKINPADYRLSVKVTKAASM